MWGWDKGVETGCAGHSMGWAEHKNGLLMV
jgi:hypothetical protein